MKHPNLTVTAASITKLLIQGAEKLDPITVYLEDMAPSKGMITISCFGQSWTSFWPAMGDNVPVSEFVSSAGPDYIVNCLSRGISRTQFCAENLPEILKREIIRRRMEGLDLDAATARELFDWVERSSYDLSHTETITLLHAQFDDLMSEVFGGEWWDSIGEASEPNPEYTYLHRIVTAVQLALKQQNASTGESHVIENKVLHDTLSHISNLITNHVRPLEEKKTISTQILLGFVDHLEQIIASAQTTGTLPQAAAPALGFKSLDDEHPVVGEKYLVRIGGKLQEDIFVFDQNDSEYGCGACYWDNGGPDDSPLFSETDEWLALSDLTVCQKGDN